MVESILNCTFDSNDLTSERSSNPHLTLKNKHNDISRYKNPIIVSNLNSPVKDKISNSFFNNSSTYTNTNTAASTFIHSANKENHSIPRVNDFIHNKWSIIENEGIKHKYRDRLHQDGIMNISNVSRDSNYNQIPLNNSNLNMINSNYVGNS